MKARRTALIRIPRIRIAWPQDRAPNLAPHTADIHANRNGGDFTSNAPELGRLRSSVPLTGP